MELTSKMPGEIQSWNFTAWHEDTKRAHVYNSHYDLNKKIIYMKLVHYRCITDDPEHATPVQGSSQGSPISHLFRAGGLFKVLYRSRRAATAYPKVQEAQFSGGEENHANCDLGEN